MREAVLWDADEKGTLKSTYFMIIAMSRTISPPISFPLNRGSPRRDSWLGMWETRVGLLGAPERAESRLPVAKGY